MQEPTKGHVDLIRAMMLVASSLGPPGSSWESGLARPLQRKGNRLRDGQWLAQDHTEGLGLDSGSLLLSPGPLRCNQLRNSESAALLWHHYSPCHITGMALSVPNYRTQGNLGDF